MYPIRKKAGYLEGLVAAMKLDENSPADKLTAGVVSLLSDLAERVEAFDDLLSELNDYVQSIDDDLTELEGMRDDDDSDFFDVQAYPAEEPFRVIENADAPAPEKMQIPARCSPGRRCPRVPRPAAGARQAWLKPACCRSRVRAPSRQYAGA